MHPNALYDEFVPRDILFSSLFPVNKKHMCLLLLLLLRTRFCSHLFKRPCVPLFTVWSTGQKESLNWSGDPVSELTVTPLLSNWLQPAIRTLFMGSWMILFAILSALLITVFFSLCPPLLPGLSIHLVIRITDSRFLDPTDSQLSQCLTSLSSIQQCMEQNTNSRRRSRSVKVLSLSLSLFAAYRLPFVISIRSELGICQAMGGRSGIEI